MEGLCTVGYKMERSEIAGKSLQRSKDFFYPFNSNIRKLKHSRAHTHKHTLSHLVVLFFSSQVAADKIYSTSIEESPRKLQI
jgi:hypothetical protein